MLVPQYETRVALTGNSVVGLLVLNGEELKQLHLAPEWRGRGLGDRFMSLKLGVWISNTRTGRDKLTAEQVDALRELGVEWA